MQFLLLHKYKSSVSILSYQSFDYSYALFSLEFEVGFLFSSSLYAHFIREEFVFKEWLSNYLVPVGRILLFKTWLNQIPCFIMPCHIVDPCLTRFLEFMIQLGCAGHLPFQDCLVCNALNLTSVFQSS